MLRRTLLSATRTTTGLLVIAAIGGTAGLLSARLPLFALAFAAVMVVLAIALIDMSLVLVLAFAASFLLTRVGPLSVADLALVVALLGALVMLRKHEIIALQPMLWAAAVYLALTAPQLLLNRYTENFLEWGHQGVLVVGSLIVGFVLGREGKARMALSVFVLICCGMAVAAIVSNLSGGDGYVGMWHKNAVGVFLMYGAIIAFANPPWMNWRPLWAYSAFALCGVGMLSSRQALVGTLLGVLVVGLRPRFHNGKRSRWMLAVLIPAAWFVWMEVSEQLVDDNPFNSASQRLTWYADSVTVWLQSPVYGVGHRWWVTWHTGYGGFQPPNAELEVLTTTGVVGLIGFLLMFGSAIWLLWRMEPVYGTLGLATVVARLTQGQFDLYWVAAHASILWIVAGICYGVRLRDSANGIVRTPHPLQTIFRRTRGARIR